MFRFLDQQGSLSRLYFFPGQLAWPLLQAEYLQQLPPSTGSISFSMDTGQRLAPGLLCRDLDHFFGVATLFVDAILTTAPPALSTAPPPAPTPDKEPEPKSITAPSPADPVKKRPQRRRTYFVTPEVLSLVILSNESKSESCVKEIQTRFLLLPSCLVRLNADI